VGSRLARKRLDLGAVQARLAAAHEKPVRLRIAASMLHHELGGRSRSAMRGPDYLARLAEAARALTEVIAVFRLEGMKKHPIAPAEVAAGALLDGGNALRTADGKLHHPLVVRRSDAISAISLLGNPKT
jgi:hypothetical protein